MIERGQRMLRTLADTLWEGTPFPPLVKEQDLPLAQIAQDYSACNRIGKIVRLWPHMLVQAPLQLKIAYEPFRVETITTSHWARPITYV